MKRRRQKIKNRKNKNAEKAGLLKKKLFIAGGSVLGFLTAVYLGTALYFHFHFLPNTEINGVDFSGRTAAELDGYLKQQIESYTLTITGRGNVTDTIRAEDISLSYKGDKETEKLLNRQNIFLWPAAFLEKEVSSAKPGIEYDENALDAKIRSLQAVAGEQSEPGSAAPEFDGTKFVPGKEEQGTAVKADVLAQKVRESVESVSEALDLEEAGCYKEPKYTSESPEVQAACDEMNRYCKASITYEMEKPVVVDAEVISGWLKVNDEMQVTFDKEAVKKWLSEFGKKYDTKGKTRSFTTADGRSAVTKEPAYCENATAASHGAQDWGSTYVEVDLTRQYMWYVKDGNIMMETNIVTGKPTPDKETPQGVYSILEMKQDKVLTGEVQADGLPEYETLVDYWMRVTWTGIGFHDATWQERFGGDWYVEHGSHGCINMSLSDAGQLYGMLEIGTPVVMHY